MSFGGAGGNLGQITSGQTAPDSSAHSLRSAPGEISTEPVATRYGFHIIRLERRLAVACCPMKWLQSTLPIICVKASSTAQIKSVARLASGARIEGIELASAEALRVH